MKWGECYLCVNCVEVRQNASGVRGRDIKGQGNSVNRVWVKGACNN